MTAIRPVCKENVGLGFAAALPPGRAPPGAGLGLRSRKPDLLGCAASEPFGFVASWESIAFAWSSQLPNMLLLGAGTPSSDFLAAPVAARFCEAPRLETRGIPPGSGAPMLRG